MTNFKHITFLAILVPMMSLAYGQSDGMKPRLVVMTDIGPADVEPDDNESAVRLMAYADCFEIEAICTSTGWNCDPYPREWAQYLSRVIDAYEQYLPNLMKRSGQRDFLPIERENGQQSLGYWPSANYIRGRTMMGSERAGIGVIGEGNDSPGSDFLIKLADEDDPRPIYVAAWGGANTLAQAVWRVRQTRTPDEIKRFLKKFRLYTITDQDMDYAKRMLRDYSSHQWLRREFSDDLMLIWDESAWLNQNELGRQNWDQYAAQIQGRGHLGQTYPTFKYGVEGDTPSFLWLMPNGLNDPEDPTQAGWGGYHVFAISPDSVTMAWTNWHEPVKSISNAFEHRFYPDEFNDFAARMQWAAEGMGNHNPVVVVDRHGMTLDASQSHDPDDDNLTYLWWRQGGDGIEILGEGARLILTPSLAADLDAGGCIVCEVHDDGPFNLVAYRRYSNKP